MQYMAHAWNFILPRRLPTPNQSLVFVVSFAVTKSRAAGPGSRDGRYEINSRQDRLRRFAIRDLRSAICTSLHRPERAAALLQLPADSGV
jgi:hypothetical protein